ncbi:hypothetical protein BAMY_15860 [Bacillus amyloliquefaciens]|uniref:Uncharacterized protein n=1 Tax=Bacillus velezensis TaxID=492670 RepID=A0A6A8LBH4_BACVE|nr:MULTISPECIES: hypothetical protein [Bacillus amyloliquefaciens group]AGF26238.1 hypothetical protein KSO_003705 [Bacillus amyloliquefaciens IT-45]AMP33316.1 hypothetical protein AS588_15490 [Bacillus amyloliquefaciens]APB83603.1 hypothetical protein BAMY_15860 [Bacillus amyloliquefaciens]ASF56486.1 hypothetical protein CEG11_15865 [Bacillus velezensis]AWM84411.1 hypothetical protein B7L90_15130 [Bacillus velezensis]
MKKSFVFLLSLVLLFSIFPISTLAIVKTSEDDTITVPGKDVKNTAVLVDAINELDEKLDMKNLSSNSPEDISQLSLAAKTLYDTIVNYENQTSASLTGTDALIIFKEYIDELNSSEVIKPVEHIVTTMGVINYKEYKISNSQIKQLSAAVGINSGFWGTATAIAKIFAKSPTALTLMLGAVPLLGMGTINACNSKGKGIIITKMGSGATNTYSCRSQ